jgi:outer membrane lipoprotein-sorting protein
METRIIVVIGLVLLLLVLSGCGWGLTVQTIGMKDNCMSANAECPLIVIP